MLFRNAIACFLIIAIGGAVLRGQQSRSVTTMGYPAVSSTRNPIPNTNAVLYYNRSKLERPKLNAVVNDKVLVGWEPVVTDFENPPANTNANAPKPDLSQHAGDAWAFYYMGRLIASGTNAPTPSELQRAFESANFPNKVVTLKRFLLQNPANLNARLELMRELKRYAYAKTRRTLNLASGGLRESPGANNVSHETKEYLSPEDDANIWGELAALFNTAFNTEEWLSVLPEFYYPYMENMALYSHSMKAVYKRNISKVEKALEERQTDLRLWDMWREMAQVTGGRILDFFPQFPSLPKESNRVWPPVSVVEWIRQEAYATQNWSKIIEFDWPWWPNRKSGLNMFAPVNKMPELTDKEIVTALRDHHWNQEIKPLFEACLHIRDFDKAAEIYFELASRPVFEREAKLAFDMAKTHNYTFPPAPQRDNSEPGAEIQSFMGDPIVGNEVRIRPQNDYNALKSLVPSLGVLRLIIIDPTATPNNIEAFRNFSNEVRRILGQGKLSEYRFLPLIATPSQPAAKELIEREGLSDNAFFWGVFDENEKYYHGGNARPTADSITDLLSSMNRKSSLDVLRDFAKNNPDSVAAKILLLGELQRISNVRTVNAQMGADDQLDGSADFDIWGEFINNANSVFSQVLARPEELFPPSADPFKIQVINNSQLLKQFAMRHIGSIENALQGRPHSKELWGLWATFSPYTPNRSLLALLSTLTPVPDLPDFPPVSLGPELIRSYKSLEDWRSIIALAEPMWEIYENMIKAEENIKHRLTQQLWEQYIVPLCEAYNKLGQEQKAEKIRADWKKAEGWSR